MDRGRTEWSEEEHRQYLRIARILDRCGIPVPRIYKHVESHWEKYFWVFVVAGLSILLSVADMLWK